MFVVLLTVLFLFYKNCCAQIFSLNGSEYARMPPVFYLDPYEPCLHANNDSGIYCHARFDLVSDGPSELYDVITEYSARTQTHYNHTQLSYGICLTKTCSQYYKQNSTHDPRATLEECLNNTLLKEYNLKAKISNEFSCEDLTKGIQLDIADIVVGAVIAILFMLIFVGSLQEICCKPKNGRGESGNPFLTCFSIKRNWRKLILPVGEGPEPRLYRLKGFHGMKAISVILIIICDSWLLFAVNTDNTQTLEEGYKEWYSKIIVNGSTVVQTFFVISGFLLAYNMQLHSENQKTTWMKIPLALINRYLRLTFPYAFVLALTATWQRHLSSGALWQSVIVTEVGDCRRNWWLHLLYINNYFDNSRCMIHTWYLAANFQLYCLSVIILVVSSGWLRKIVLAMLFGVGVIYSAVNTYNLNLDGALILSPESARNSLITDPTFNNMFKRGHTNLPSFIIGLSLGLAVYHWQTTGAKFQGNTKLRILTWLSVPVALGVSMLSSILYMEATRASLHMRMMFAALQRPLFAGILGFLIVGMIFKFEDVYRRILEWRGWVVFSRVSYCAFLHHMFYTRIGVGAHTALVHISLLHMCEIASTAIALSFGAAVPFYLTVEGPFKQLVQLCMSRHRVGENAHYTVNDTKLTETLIDGNKTFLSCTKSKKQCNESNSNRNCNSDNSGKSNSAVVNGHQNGIGDATDEVKENVQ